ncbi:hypothetical protein [Leucobacter salsicius]|uniref:hypothetical protein n=1 Tax=Leucobacter salsicius TaxID=664638 RepID=UPI000476B0FA|nr:hypothetical protein [Leucobacter salsicius]
MAGLEDYREVGQRINAQCRLPNDAGEWWGKMLTNIALAIGPKDASEVAYVTAVYSEDDYEIAVVTDSLLILGEAEKPLQDDAEFSVRVFSMREIESVEMNVSASFFNGGFMSDWPGRYAVSFKHPLAGSFSFPYSSEQNNYADDQLAVLVPKLIDIVRSRA